MLKHTKSSSEADRLESHKKKGTGLIGPRSFFGISLKEFS